MKLLLVTFCLFAYSLACTSDSSCPTGKICKFGSCFSRDEVIIPGDCADPNEEWLQCAVDCRPTCSNPNPWCKPDCSKSGCHCKSDFVYENGRCVSKSTCRGSARPSSSFTTSRPSTQKELDSKPRYKQVKNGDACFTDSECLSYNCKSGFCAAPGTSSFHPPPSPAPTRTSWSSSSSSSTSLSSGSCRKDRDCGAGLLCARGGQCAMTDKIRRREGELCEYTSQCEGMLLCNNEKCSKIRH